MSTSSFMVTMLIVIGLVLLGAALYWALGLIARLRRSYQEMRGIAAKIQEIREKVVKIQETTVQLERPMVLEQLADLVRRSTKEGVVDQDTASKMLTHIWQLQHDALSMVRVSY